MIQPAAPHHAPNFAESTTPISVKCDCDSMRPERSNENSYFGVGERRSGDKGEAGAGEAAAAESTGAAAEDGGWGGVASDVAVGLCTLNQVDP